MRKTRHRLFADLHHICGQQIHLQTTGMELGHVQHIHYHIVQPNCTGFDHLHHLMQFIIWALGLQEFGQVDDAIDGRAYLVAQDVHGLFLENCILLCDLLLRLILFTQTLVLPRSLPVHNDGYQ